MKPHTTRFPLPAPDFQFAGFSFPKWVFTLPHGSKAKRLANYKAPCTGPYYHSPKILTGYGDGSTFFLESDGMPGMRWQWCDEVDGACIHHTGWFCDDFQDSKIRGLVMRLPHGRGFIAGWSMGEHMASFIETSFYAEISHAAYAADSLAESAAEAQREYEEKEHQQEEEREAMETALNEPACLI